MWKITKFFRLSSLERRLFLEAVFWCGVARLAVLLLPFRKYAWLLGKPQNTLGGNEENKFKNGPVACPPAKENEETKKDSLPRQIALAVSRASRHVPWKTRCLVEAIAVKKMLRRLNIDCTIYLGVARENGQMIAHAWLECENIILTGKKSTKKFTTVSIFK